MIILFWIGCLNATLYYFKGSSEFCFSVNIILLFILKTSFIVIVAKALNVDLFSEAPSAVILLTIIPYEYSPHIILGNSESNKVEDTPDATAYLATTNLDFAFSPSVDHENVILLCSIFRYCYFVVVNLCLCQLVVIF